MHGRDERQAPAPRHGLARTVTGNAPARGAFGRPALLCLLLGGGWLGDANSATTQRYHRTVLQGLTMAPNNLGGELNPLLCRDIRQTQESGVRNLIEIDEVAKVGVDCYQDPALGLREFQQSPVPWVLAERASFEDVVPLLA